MIGLPCLTCSHLEHSHCLSHHNPDKNYLNLKSHKI